MKSEKNFFDTAWFSQTGSLNIVEVTGFAKTGSGQKSMVEFLA